DADDADRLTRPRPPAVEASIDAGRRFDEHAGRERHGVGKKVHDVPRYRHVLAVATRSRESDLVVVHAQVRLALSAAPTPVAGDHALADDALAHREVRDPVADLGDRPAPLVPWD